MRIKYKAALSTVVVIALLSEFLWLVYSNESFAVLIAQIIFGGVTVFGICMVLILVYLTFCGFYYDRSLSRKEEQ